MTLLTRQVIQAISESVERGCTPRRAAMALGISDQTLYSWIEIAEQRGRKTTPETAALAVELLDGITRARAKCYQTLTDALYANATTVNPKTGWIDTQAADKLLSKSPDHRDEWHEHSPEPSSTIVLPIAYQRAHEIAETGGVEALERELLALEGPQPQSTNDETSSGSL